MEVKYITILTLNVSSEIITINQKENNMSQNRSLRDSRVNPSIITPHIIVHDNPL
ncbi:hypothetical protein J6590_097316, partial [Homalodisca vitripennis]